MLFQMGVSKGALSSPQRAANIPNDKDSSDPINSQLIRISQK